jgi:hypothetical protein
MKKWMAIFLVLLLGACASYSGRGLKPGVDRLENVLDVMGQPAMRWQNPDNSVQLAYPRGPMGFHTYMVDIGSDGKLRWIENVMYEKHFSRIQPGMTKEDVLYTLGPSFSGGTAYFKARDELAWEWRYCDAWNAAARFYVLFDNSKETVRKTLSITESCGWEDCPCSR